MAAAVPRIGFGYDSHVFEEGRPLVLGGVAIPGCAGLKAHSDGDALIHALIDAMLGAAALGDIGAHFPDTDARWKGADSRDLLARTAALVEKAGLRLGNADVTVICQKPRLRPFIDAIRESLAAVLRVEPSAISVKGKTNEGMDAVGRSEGLAVHAAVLLFPL